MGSVERRTRERENTRAKIVDAARKMFVLRGYEATTMRGIADEVEYTPTAIYHHFRNKEALLKELCAIDFRALALTFQKIGRVEDPIERLQRLGEAYVEYAHAHPMQYQLMFMTPRPHFELDAEPDGDPSMRAYHFLQQTCVDAIATKRLRPEFNDPDTLAQMAWATVHGLVSLRIVKAHDDWIAWGDLRKSARQACRTLIRGMLKESAD